MADSTSQTRPAQTTNAGGDMGNPQRLRNALCANIVRSGHAAVPMSTAQFCRTLPDLPRDGNGADRTCVRTDIASSSDESTPHDQPWHFFSMVLRGRFRGVSRPGRWRTPGQVAFRRATHTHRVVLAADERGCESPCTTLVVTGPWLRPWGFWCDRERFVPRQDFGDGGCGDLR